MKVGIVGSGYVGSTAAYAMALQGSASHIVLIDINHELAAANAEDILHATPWAHSTKISAGGYQQLRGTDAVILACGVSQKKGETRLALMNRNADVFRTVVPQVMQYAPDALIIVATNPVDVITQLVINLSGLDPNRVIGSGTILDTARFRTLLAEHLHVSPHSVHAYVLGEHGDSEVLAWSSARVGGMILDDFARQTGNPINQDIISAIDEKVRHAAYRIIEGKGATYYGIGAGLSRIVKAVRDDEGTVLTVSSLCKGKPGKGKLCMSVPRVVRQGGLGDEIWPDLSDEESSSLLESADIIQQAVQEITA